MKDFHQKPFSEPTKIKLDLFKLYLREWLPVFISRRKQEILIVDFFSGPGSDTDGSIGSPLIILNTLNEYRDRLVLGNIKISIIFNDFQSSKIDDLKKSTSDYKIPNCEYRYCTIDFKELLPIVIAEAKEKASANLFFMDQCGFSAVDAEAFLEIIALPQTDFMFFLSSSFIYRFIELDFVAADIPIDRGKFTKENYNKVTKLIREGYEKLLTSA